MCEIAKRISFITNIIHKQYLYYDIENIIQLFLTLLHI